MKTRSIDTAIEPPAVSGPVSFVNPLQGTYSAHGFSTGNTLPLIALPHGMTHWSAQTTGGAGGWYFHPQDRTFTGIRATHQPSPWMGDYGYFVLMPQTGVCKPEAWERSSAYNPEKSVFQPGYFAAHLLRDRCQVEVTPTERCALLRVEQLAPEMQQPGRRLLLDLFPAESEIAFDAGRNQVTGLTRVNNSGVPENFAFYFVIAPNVPIAEVTIVEARDGHRIAVIELQDGEQSEIYTAQIGTSFISVEQAERNIRSEIGGRDFDTVRDDATQIWNDRLSRVTVTGATESQSRTLYSCLYRALLFPRKLHEPDVEGKPYHYSPYDGEVYPGVLYTDNGFWDTFRTVYPLLSIVYPDLLGEIIEGWLQAYRESGWLPEWASPGHRACMIGTHSQVVIADAVTKGIPGFDYETALHALIKGATGTVPDGAAYGREALHEYETLGYVPSDRISKGTSRTLDYAYDDYCIAQVARAAGREDLYEQFIAGSQRWRNVFDPETRFFRGRLASGEWEEGFDPYEWGGAFVEGSAWQFRFAVPHDPHGLAEAFGGPAAMAEQIAAMVHEAPTYGVGTYQHTIHEMTEMAVAGYGQYAHSNQPVHATLHMATAVGQPQICDETVRRVLNDYYTPNILPGDEDNGEMASWYVLAALGTFPLCPGNPVYVLNYPLFSEATIALPNGNTLRILAEPVDVVPESYTITWNGEPLSEAGISHADLAVGGELRFG